ncbi:hypothetical protein UNSWDHB_2787 [Dehalobacter sp. UNSWDHB]|uniref:ABC-2 transporter permease n=1 Tax=unclassified Dehalobacter TaxID=2635733 RepID=UPI00028B010E|nr:MULTISPECIES: ABC-2 transporter permease [unclassified Dehalobacter]AFV03940.1 hypothetical protein DHBDCA_p2913 [Dehalobacter sp. DCA]AFV06918.1 hypothetical protein DCF50_p2915 [Dehalobacter sp. CF]EQB19953.1 hypothetical protein UNSWDHB_2787 [Dehalobacter sp. UNSWDHB]
MSETDPVRRNSSSLILEIQGLGKYFSEFELSDVTFSLEKGYRLGYMRSRWANFISMFVIFGLIGAMGQLIKIPAGELETTNQELEQLTAVLNGYAGPVICLMMFVVGMVLLVLSFKVSVRIYKNKDF